MASSIELADLKKYYGVRGIGSSICGRAFLKAVDGVTFSIRGGKTVSLIGESG